METTRSPSQGFTGTMNLQLPDLIQMVCLCRSNATIRIKSRHGDGSIHIKGGKILHAETRLLKGEPAFLAIFGWKDGHFELESFQEDGSVSIDKPWEHLLLEAMRQQDERSGSGEVEENEGDFEAEVVSSLIEDHLEDEIDRAFEALEPAAPQWDQGVLEEKRTGYAAPARVKVLIVEDSLFFATRLRTMLEADEGIDVAGVARNGKEALNFLESGAEAHLITLDLQMPVMKGDTALRHIMIRHPVPVVIISSLQSQYVEKAFEFFQLGAVDVMWKPEAGEDLLWYEERLRDIVKRASRAEVSRFRRWRKPKVDLRQPLEGLAAGIGAADASDRLMVIVGAEGAYMDWFRIPLAGLEREGLVVGFQRLPEIFLNHFCRLLKDLTMARVEPLREGTRVTPGRVYIGSSGGMAVNPGATAGKGRDTEACALKSSPWIDGIELRLRELAEQFQERLSVCLLSGAHILSNTLVERLLEQRALFIVSPRDAVMCTDLVDGMEVYRERYSRQILCKTPEQLMEVWLSDGPNN